MQILLSKKKSMQIREIDDIETKDWKNTGEIFNKLKRLKQKKGGYGNIISLSLFIFCWSYLIN